MLSDREQAEFEAIVIGLRQGEPRRELNIKPAWSGVALGLSISLIMIGVVAESVLIGVGGFVFAVVSAVRLIRVVELKRFLKK